MKREIKKRKRPAANQKEFKEKKNGQTWLVFNKSRKKETPN